MKKLIALLLAGTMAIACLAGCGGQKQPVQEATSIEDAAGQVGEFQPGKIGFVTFSTAGDFFQALADDFVATFTEAGWQASYVDGEFNPEKQINACETYIADGVDVIMCWAAAPAAMDGVITQCKDAGVKFISFVQRTSEYDALMVSDDELIASYCNMMAAQWIDAAFADAPDHSVSVYTMNPRATDSNVLQADILNQIELYSAKAKFVEEIQIQEETAEGGQAAAENLYARDNSVKAILSVSASVARGANQYFTSIGSPVSDLSQLGIFCINGGESESNEIVKSGANESALRGTIMTGSVHDTALEMLMVATGVCDGSLPYGFIRNAGTLVVTADTAQEFLDTGKVVSFVAEDLAAMFPGVQYKSAFAE